jgi:hypothetical protein
MMHVPDSFILITPRSEQLKYNNMIPPAMQKVYSQAALAQLLSFDLWRASFYFFPPVKSIMGKNEHQECERDRSWLLARRVFVQHVSACSV